MKDSLVRLKWITAGVILCVQLLSACEVADLGISQVDGESSTVQEISNNGETANTQETGNIQGTGNTREDYGIPYRFTPDLPEYVMPAEVFADPLEEEAAEIIDPAICKAIACVSVMKGVL